MNSSRTSRVVSGLAGIVASAFVALSCTSHQPIYPHQNAAGWYESVVNNHLAYESTTIYGGSFVVRSVSLQYSGLGPSEDIAYELEILKQTTPQKVATWLREHGIDKEAEPGDFRTVEVGTRLRYIRHFMPGNPFMLI